MKKLFFVLLPISTLVACSGNAETTDTHDDVSMDTTSVDSLTIDSLALENPDRIKIDVSKMMAKASEEYSLPLTIDSTFIADLDTDGNNEEGNMTNAEAIYLSFDFVDNDPTSMASYDVETFIRLDSMKIRGEYEDYQDHLDLGQARFSNASVIGKVSINENQTMLIWTTDYATYEACPYGYGTCVFGTLFHDNVGQNTVLLGEISGGGDAPYWGSTLVTSKITADKVKMKSVSENGGDEDPETGEEIIESSSTDLVVKITAEGFSEN